MLKKILNTQEKLVRKKRALGEKDANITGVCEGMGEYIGINPWYIRLGFAGFTFLMPWVAIPAYIALALLLPNDDKSAPLGSQLFNKATHSYYKKSSTYSSPDSPDSFVICDNCNTAVKQDSKFCHNCGTKL